MHFLPTTQNITERIQRTQRKLKGRNFKHSEKVFFLRDGEQKGPS